MTRVVTQGRYRLYVYPEEHAPHNLPHCHVYWPDGSCVVSIDDPHVLAGTDNRQAVELAQQHHTAIRAEWKRLNA